MTEKGQVLARSSAVRIHRDVARLAAPVIAQSLLHTLVFLVDRAMLGRFSDDALASLQISGPIVWSLSSLVGAIQVGAIAVVGRGVGAQRREDAAAAVRAGLIGALGFGLLGAVLGMLAIPLILAAFPAAGEGVHAQARGYLEAFLPGMPVMLLATMAAGVHQAAGDTRTPLLVALAANVVNAVASYALIFGRFGAPVLGARGAAIGSVVALGLECVVLCALLWRGRGVVSMRGRGGERAQLARMANVAGPAMLERAFQHVGFLVFVGMIGALGPLAMAANQTLIGIESVAFLSADGFGIAAAAIVAQRLGAGRVDEAARGARAAMTMGVAALSLCGLAFLLAPRALASAFSPDHAIVEAVVPCLAVAAAAQPFMACSVILGEAFRGAGATRVTLAITMIGAVGVRLIATWYFAFELELGLIGVWMGSALDWMVRTVLFAWLFVRGTWAHTTV